MGGTVVWFTLSARDPEGLGGFYRDLLGWDVEEARLTSDTGAGGVFRSLRTGGLPGSISAEDEHGVVLVVEVDDLDATVEQARGLGIAEIQETYEFEGLRTGDGTYRVAWMRDPEGNRLALLGAASG